MHGAGLELRTQQLQRDATTGFELRYLADDFRQIDVAVLPESQLTEDPVRPQAIPFHASSEPPEAGRGKVPVGDPRRAPAPPQGPCTSRSPTLARHEDEILASRRVEGAARHVAGPAHVEAGRVKAGPRSARVQGRSATRFEPWTRTGSLGVGRRARASWGRRAGCRPAPA